MDARLLEWVPYSGGPALVFPGSSLFVNHASEVFSRLLGGPLVPPYREVWPAYAGQTLAEALEGMCTRCHRQAITWGRSPNLPNQAGSPKNRQTGNLPR